MTRDQATRFYEGVIDDNYVALCASTDPKARRQAADQFMAAVRARNSIRTPLEVRELEKAKGLR